MGLCPASYKPRTNPCEAEVQIIRREAQREFGRAVGRHTEELNALRGEAAMQESKAFREHRSLESMLQ